MYIAPTCWGSLIWVVEFRLPYLALSISSEGIPDKNGLILHAHWPIAPSGAYTLETSYFFIRVDN